MAEKYKFAYLGGVGEIIEKKSRFITLLKKSANNIGMPITTALHLRLENVIS